MSLLILLAPLVDFPLPIGCCSPEAAEAAEAPAEELAKETSTDDVESVLLVG
jgi:hypothetical protein